MSGEAGVPSAAVTANGFEPSADNASGIPGEGARGSIDRQAEIGFSLATGVLAVVWMGVEAVALACAFWMVAWESQWEPADFQTAVMAVCLASVPATLVLWLIWLFCGPRGRRGQRLAAAMGLVALAVWVGVDQLAAFALQPNLTLLFPSAGSLGIAITRGPLLLVWWLWGTAVAVFFYRYFCRGQITRNIAVENGPLRSWQLMGITLLVSVTAAGSRWWARMLPIDWTEVVLTTAVVFGFGVCAGACFLCLTVGLLQSMWRGYGGLLLALVVTSVYVGTTTVAMEKMITTEWVVSLMVGLAAGLIHYALFLLPLRAGGFRLRSAADPAANPAPRSGAAT